MTTIINLSNETKNLPQVISNWNEIPQEAKKKMLSGTDYRFIGFQELLIYNDRQVIASCEMFVNDNNTVELMNGYDKQGQLF